MITLAVGVLDRLLGLGPDVAFLRAFVGCVDQVRIRSRRQRSIQQQRHCLRLYVRRPDRA